MKSQPLQRYFFFGTCVRYLQDANVNSNLDDDQDGWGIKTNLQQLFQYIEDLNLPVSRRHLAIWQLRQDLHRLEQLPAGSKLSLVDSIAIQAHISPLRGTLDAELEGVSAYTLTPKRYDVGLLTENVSELFAPGAYDSLPGIAQYDLREAGQCLAFERFTASAFHLMRGTEAILRAFYGALVKRGRSQTMWGPIIADLRKRKAAKAYSVLLDNLDNIRRSFRNPTQHPEATYDINSVQDLWGLCIDAINRMSRAF